MTLQLCWRGADGGDSVGRAVHGDHGPGHSLVWILTLLVIWTLAFCGRGSCSFCSFWRFGPTNCTLKLTYSWNEGQRPDGWLKTTRRLPFKIAAWKLSMEASGSDHSACSAKVTECTGCSPSWKMVDCQTLSQGILSGYRCLATVTSQPDRGEVSLSDMPSSKCLSAKASGHLPKCSNEGIL